MGGAEKTDRLAQKEQDKNETGRYWWCSTAIAARGTDSMGGLRDS